MREGRQAAAAGERPGGQLLGLYIVWEWSLAAPFWGIHRMAFSALSTLVRTTLHCAAVGGWEILFLRLAMRKEDVECRVEEWSDGN